MVVTRGNGAKRLNLLPLCYPGGNLEPKPGSDSRFPASRWKLRETLG